MVDASQQKSSQGPKRQSKRQQLYIGGGFAKVGFLQIISLVIITLGIIQYFLRISFVSITGTLLLSFVLFILSGYALAQKLDGQGVERIQVLAPMLFFCLWYFVWGGRYDFPFIAYFLVAFSFILFAPLLVVENKEGALKAELYGLLPVIFLFLDIGFIPWLVGEVGLAITPAMENLILFMPWWALFGIYLLPKIENPWLSFGAGFLKFAGLLYIIFVFISPAIPGLGQEGPSAIDLLPGAEELEQAQQRFREVIPDRENPVKSNLACIFSDPTNVPACVKERQQSSEDESRCEQLIELGQFPDNDLGKRRCLLQQKERREEEKGAAQGTASTNFDILTKAKFDELEINLFDEEKPEFTGVFKMENPRQNPIELEMACFLTQSVRKSNIKIEGTMEYGGGSIAFDDKKKEIPVRCTFNSEQLTEVRQGRKYDVNFRTTLRNLETTASLTRVFFVSKDAKKEWESTLRSTQFSSKDAILSSAPHEFARLNFNLGTSNENPFIVKDDRVRLTVSVENLGQGNITRIHSYEINAEGITTADGCELGNNIVPKSSSKVQRLIYKDSCGATVGDQLTSSSSYVERTFFGTLRYDYEVRDKFFAVQIKEEKLTEDTE